MDLKKKFAQIFKHKKKPTPKKKTVTIADGVEVPKQWVKKKTQQGYKFSPKEKTRSWNMPSIIALKRLLALIMAVAHFTFSQVVFTGPMPIMGIFFLLTSFLLLDYVWRTRHLPEVFEKVKSVEKET